MILDSLLAFSQAQNLAQVAGTYPSSNVIDLGNLGLPTTNTATPQILGVGQVRDIGIGDDPALKLLVQVITAFTGTTGTLQVALQGAIDDASGNPSTFNSWWLSPVYTLATLVAGARLYDMDMPRPPALLPIPRFLRLSYVIATATMTAGTVSAFIVLDRMDQVYNSTINSIMGGYPAGITVAN